MHPIGMGRQGLFQPGLEGTGGQWPADQVALGGVALPVFEQAQAVLEFDTFSHHFQAQVVAHLDGRTHDYRVFTGFIQVANKLLIDFQLLYRQAFEVSQR